MLCFCHPLMKGQGHWVQKYTLFSVNFTTGNGVSKFISFGYWGIVTMTVTLNLKITRDEYVTVKPPAHIQDRLQDCVTISNPSAIVKKCQDYWSFKTALWQHPDSFLTVARLPYDGYNSVMTVLWLRHDWKKKKSKFNVFFCPDRATIAKTASWQVHDCVTTMLWPHHNRVNSNVWREAANPRKNSLVRTNRSVAVRFFLVTPFFPCNTHKYLLWISYRFLFIFCKIYLTTI